MTTAKERGTHNWVPRSACPQGHPYSPENTYVDKHGYKHCRTCRRERMQGRRTPGVGQGGHNKAKTCCPQGHEYTSENTAIYRGRRACRTCARANNAIQIIKKYGITAEQYEAMFTAQEGKCAVCRVELMARPDIDHDHKCCSGAKACGKCVRGLLCRDCNIGISRFEDDPVLLRAAAEYLDQHA